MSYLRFDPMAVVNKSIEFNGVEVVHRSGATTELDISKIKSVVRWCCDYSDRNIPGPYPNPNALESAIKCRFNKKITTKQIQDNLIQCALSFCSPLEPYWRRVAGLLVVWGIWKDAIAARKVESAYTYSGYRDWLLEKIDLGHHVDLLHIYTLEEIEESYSWIDSGYDRDFDYAGITLLTSRYLLNGELPQECFLANALLLAAPEPKDSRLSIAHQAYLALAKRQISLATPTLANLRIPNSSLSSCFILTCEDSIHSIFDNIKNAALISKNGGGIGMNLSSLRAVGSSVMGVKNASGGVIPWIKIFNDTAIAVNQGGRRAGAITVAIDIWHLDVPDFLEMQAENGEQRRKCYDVFPQLVICDLFMTRVKNRQTWNLVDPHEVKMKLGIDLPTLWGEELDKAIHKIDDAINQNILSNFKTVPALDLFKKIMQAQLETGMPYLAFKDTINKANPNKHEGMIPSVNLCVESYSNVSPQYTHTCNLQSINLANVEKSDLQRICTLAVRLLDNTIELTNPPISSSVKHNERYRTIGIGVMGLADYLAKHEKKYQDLDFIGNLFEEFGYWCTKASMELSKERGYYPAFNQSDWSKGLLIGSKSVDWYEQNSTEPQRWKDLSIDIQKYGIRNSHITAIAPNTSSALIQGCTSSVLPAYGRFHIDKNSKGATPIAPAFIEDRYWFYQENKYLHQAIVIDAIAEIQKWIDTGISAELLFNLNEGIYFPDDPQRKIVAQDIYDVLFRAWEKGVKAIYYVRSVQNDTSKALDCDSCSN